MSVLAQGGHDHLLSVGIDIGPTILRVAVLLAVPVVAGHVLMRGFQGDPGRRTAFAVVAAAAVAASFELLLSGGLGLPEQLVPLLLLGLALPLYLILSTDPRFATAVAKSKRAAPWIFAAVSVPALWWLAKAWFGSTSPAATATALHTGVVLALVALAWFVIARSRIPVRALAAAVASALMLATAQAIVVAPPSPAPGVAVATEVDAGSRPVGVVVVPNRPGLNLVHVQATDAAIGLTRNALAPTAPMAGTTGGWATIRLPAGRSTIYVQRDGTTAEFETATAGASDPLPGLAGPDGPECASALLGEALAHVATELERCPAEFLDPRDAQELLNLAQPRMTVITDDSQRAKAAVQELRRAGVEIAPEGSGAPILVLTGWAGAEKIAEPDAILAPWLEKPTDARYLHTLGTNYPGEQPSAAGHRAWQDARGENNKQTNETLSPNAAG